ncbi:outer membrane lipoprotein-sorting protein [Sulfurimonas aquatica]|uniref:Outer membrane lipoprotein-sorting protein n=1 Tax=Sulfurimonas aquatica TaxID=2672570 RepID=A0A975B0R8_9BACT|nr:outer membrane lipoprotein-sorting protein [Sulfurimonas aquatica]QSZ42015.1 outer membrane lipoprotein-sorting protein [Sulfurimonas aquatica]
MNKTLLSLLFSFTLLFSNEALEIMKKVDNNMRGENVYMKLNLSITSMGHTRVMKMESWSQGSDKSFVKTLYPPKDRGITFLSLDNQMWQYIPKIERVIKIPPSMMLQNWMGTDITNDDIVKQSSLIEDYTAKLLKRESNIATIELVPREDAAVVWGKIVSKIDTDTYTSTQDTFYDEDGLEVRVFTYKDVKKIGKYFIPTIWRITPLDKQGNFTEIKIEDVAFDTEISDTYFNKSALKRFSR